MPQRQWDGSANRKTDLLRSVRLLLEPKGVMKRIKMRWVLLGILCFFILAFCINMFVQTHGDGSRKNGDKGEYQGRQANGSTDGPLRK